MMLVRCVKCNTPVMTEDSFEERIMEEKNELVNEQTKLLKIKRTNPKHKDIKKINLRLMEIISELSMVNEFLRLTNHHKRTNRQEIYNELLMDELKKIGYKKDFFVELNKKTSAILEQQTTEYQEYKRNFHNEWHNDKGQYDPTAKLALDNIKD